MNNKRSNLSVKSAKSNRSYPRTKSAGKKFKGFIMAKSTVNKAGNYTQPTKRKEFLIELKPKLLMVLPQVSGQLEKHKL